MTAVASRLHEPQALYRQWEQGQWDPWKVELERDRGDWARLGEDDRGLVLWALSSLMVAEERITTQFAALVMAGESEEETSYLATQQVDEARHMQFYARYQDEVIADPASIDAHVQRARTRLGPSFGVIFDEALVHAHARLAAAPRDPAAKVAFVTTYHMVIEGTLGLTAFNFISRYFEDQDVLGGFVEGYARIHHDEQRHLAYGTWYLQQAVAGRAELGDTVRATLRELLPAVAAALSPPDREGVDFEALGAGSDEIRQFALTGLTRRLAVVGVPIETVAG